MTCDQATMMLERRWDGALNREEESMLDEHIHACESCRAEARAIALADAAFLHLPDDPPPVNIAAMVSRRLAEETPVEPQRGFFWAAVSLACAFAAIVWCAAGTPVAWLHSPAAAAVTAPITHTLAVWLRPVSIAFDALAPALVLLAKWAPVPMVVELAALGVWWVRRHDGQVVKQS